MAVLRAADTAELKASLAAYLEAEAERQRRSKLLKLKISASTRELRAEA